VWQKRFPRCAAEEQSLAGLCPARGLLPALPAAPGQQPGRAGTAPAGAGRLGGWRRGASGVGRFTCKKKKKKKEGRTPKGREAKPVWWLFGFLLCVKLVLALYTAQICFISPKMRRLTWGAEQEAGPRPRAPRQPGDPPPSRSHRRAPVTLATKKWAQVRTRNRLPGFAGARPAGSGCGKRERLRAGASLPACLPPSLPRCLPPAFSPVPLGAAGCS